MRGILLLLILAINAQAASRGFWYPGYRHADNPFVKKGRQLWVSPKGEAARIPEPANTTVRPAFFPHTASEIDAAVAAIQKYFRDHNPQQIAADKSDILENLFDKLEVQYTTVPSDYALFPPMSQDKDDGTYGVH